MEMANVGINNDEDIFYLVIFSLCPHLCCESKAPVLPCSIQVYKLAN